jgi:hypothetical protein
VAPAINAAVIARRRCGVSSMELCGSVGVMGPAATALMGRVVGRARMLPPRRGMAGRLAGTTTRPIAQPVRYSAQGLLRPIAFVACIKYSH